MGKVPKFVFECQHCGKCCERTPEVYLNDIEKWRNAGALYQFIPNLEIIEDYGSIQIQLKNKFKESNTCPMYDSKEKKCTAYENRPITCETYPLGYNGENYILLGRECAGLGKGKMTKESLKNMRDTARKYYEDKKQTELLLPVLQGLFMEHITKETMKVYENLTDEQKEELHKIWSKQKES
ncbi:MAG: YkgJ family cysteine cluster protein, partial [Methanosarcinales archaeon]